ncbi:response regulator transcription factor [bacterium]|nr:MAG: response regulator transcription factor [bacterium]
MIQLALVEDNSSQIKSLIDEFSSIDFIELGICSMSGEEFLIELSNSTELPDFALVDVEMPGMNGIETVIKIKERFPSITCIMFSVLDDELTLYNAIQAGASGYFLKEDDIEQISQHLKQVKEFGALPFTPRMALKALELIKKATPPPSENADSILSQRELEILQLLSEGHNAQTIAEKLFVSFHTVRKHMMNIYTKLEVNSKTEAIKIGLKNSWLRL